MILDSSYSTQYKTIIHIYNYLMTKLKQIFYYQFIQVSSLGKKSVSLLKPVRPIKRISIQSFIGTLVSIKFVYSSKDPGKLPSLELKLLDGGWYAGGKILTGGSVVESEDNFVHPTIAEISSNAEIEKEKLPQGSDCGIVNVNIPTIRTYL
ncbi:hypothetical protein R3W88_026734 [Solanum pinnatisectum]|uniref:Uncharacterized protein n=1 Tax=Solanum pinnatisectum TaxID=50273 RepID=A0AAV9LE29_9SOLN|nr:hypothetical protein R3W88_026734 [Solanum pinnatisectum]